MNALRKVNWADVCVRAVKTGVQAFVGLQGSAALLDWLGGSVPVDTNGIRVAAASAIIATVSYVWNVVVQAVSPDPAPGSREALARDRLAALRESSRVSAAGGLIVPTITLHEAPTDPAV